MLQSQSSGWLFETDMHPGNVNKSVRFDDGSSSHLTFTPGSASSAIDRRKITHSVWVKRGVISTGTTLYSSTKSGGGDYYQWRFSSDDKMTLILDVDDSNFGYDTTAVYRDTTNWYHFLLIIDTTQSTNTDRVKLYANGVLQTLNVKYSSHVSQNFETYVMDGTEDDIGEFNYNGSTYFDGCMAEFITTIGQNTAVSDFGADVNGVWLPKAYSGNYGTNGFRLSFSQTGTSANSSGIGADTSGNGNHFTPVNLTAADVFDDVPSNNFCTLNSTGRRNGSSHAGTFSQGNLKVASGGNATDVFGTMAINQICATGGIYFEIRLDSIDASRTYFGLIGDNGISNKNDYGASYGYPIKAMVQSGGYMYFGTQQNGSAETNIGGGALSGDYRTIATYTNGDVIGYAVKSDGKVFISKNGTFINSLAGAADPDNGTNPIHVIDLDQGDWVPYVGYNSTFSVNFGQDDTFAGQETSNGVTGGGGKFLYAPPSWAKALCSRNLPESTFSSNPTNPIGDPSNAFNIFLYEGTNATNRNLALNTFTPDWVWLKSRSQADNHVLVDSLRRDGDNFPNVHANVTDPEASDSHPKIITNGIQVSQGLYDNNGVTFVAWCWKAGGAPTATNSGGQNPTSGSVMIDGSASPAALASATKYPDKMSVNTNAGFSIVTYTANNNTSCTIPHGLNSAPNVVIIKNRDTSSNGQWVIGQDQSGFTGQMYFDSGAFSTNSGSFNNTAPTNTLVPINTDNTVNEGTDEFVMYCFHSVEGFSKIGSYIGNGSSDGTFVYTGFRPAWIMTKSTGSGNWYINDTARSPGNPTSSFGDNLYADLNNGESGNGMDILSNGFKIRNTDASQNSSTVSYFYMAFAEGSFKDINAR